MKRPVLVTGARGFIGRHLVGRLLRDGQEVVALVRGSSPIEGTATVRCPLEELTAETWRQAGHSGFDVVYHLGSFTPKNARAANSVDDVFRSNLLGTRALLESLPTAPGKIVFASSLDVYAPLPDGVYNEASPCRPATLYGASKLFCEQLIRCESARGAQGVILRYGHIFGPGEEAFEKIIPTLVRQMLAGETPTLVGDGSTLRDFLYVDDAVEATLRASERACPGPLNVVSGNSVSLREVAQWIAQSADYHGTIHYDTTRPPGQSIRFDATALREQLNFAPTVPVAEGLRREVDAARRKGAPVHA